MKPLIAFDFVPPGIKRHAHEQKTSSYSLCAGRGPHTPDNPEHLALKLLKCYGRLRPTQEPSTSTSLAPVADEFENLPFDDDLK
eukprot:gene11187-biopygen3121